jgi:hypothetical protein
MEANAKSISCFWWLEIVKTSANLYYPAIAQSYFAIMNRLIVF